MGGRAVPARPPGLLEIAFERTRDLGMHDRANVGLVDPHAERVGSDHHVELAVVEVALDFALAFWRKAGVKVLRGEPPVGKRLGCFLGVPLGRAIDDGSARARLPKRVLDRPMDVFGPL